MALAVATYTRPTVVAHFLHRSSRNELPSLDPERDTFTSTARSTFDVAESGQNTQCNCDYRARKRPRRLTAERNGLFPPIRFDERKRVTKDRLAATTLKHEGVLDLAAALAFSCAPLLAVAVLRQHYL